MQRRDSLRCRLRRGCGGRGGRCWRGGHSCGRGGEDAATASTPASTTLPADGISSTNNGSFVDGDDGGSGSGDDGGGGVAAASETRPLVGAIAGASIVLLLVLAGLLFMAIRRRRDPSMELLVAQHKLPGGQLSPATLKGPSAPMISPYQLQYQPTGFTDEYLAAGGAATQRARKEHQGIYAAPAAVLAGYTEGAGGGGGGGGAGDYVTIAGDVHAAREHVSKYMDIRTCIVASFACTYRVSRLQRKDIRPRVT